MDHSPVSAPPRPVVELVCPPPSTSGLASDIRARGNIPLSIDGTALLELFAGDILESWKATARLPAQRVAALSWQLAHDIAEDDEPEIHGQEAAALFLLALRRNQADLQKALGGCRIRWNDRATREKVEYLA
jgi:hypothetical protein